MRNYGFICVIWGINFRGFLKDCEETSSVMKSKGFGRKEDLPAVWFADVCVCV